MGKIPPYAILSHTWGAAEEEVTFKDMVDNTGKQKTGYRKIEFCGKEAAKKCLQHFWVDTCCIDKSSSAELSEAINSMYHWYREAEICFAYLEDIQPDQNSSVWPGAGSRWFSRGWTLQELIAPHKVEFFAGDWTFLGTKIECCVELSSITNIHVQALKNRAVSTFSVAQKMSWASGRVTTRSEDIAYCLIGLFDANMPLLYGEGGEKAFIRLQEDIMKNSDDQSLFAWTQPATPRTMHRGLLANSPMDFAHSSDIIPVRDPRRSHPYSMANAGLRITLLMSPLRKLPSGEERLFREGLLNCISENRLDRLVTLCLRRPQPDTDQYVRVIVGEMEYLPHQYRGLYSRETIYVRKNPTQDAFDQTKPDMKYLDSHGRLHSWFSIWRRNKRETLKVSFREIAIAIKADLFPSKYNVKLKNPNQLQSMFGIKKLSL